VAKVKIEDSLYDRAKRASESAGYSSPEEFIADCVEKEIKRLKVEEEESRVTEQLRGLGYVE
jgi:metal-responsive CopG/Arc/MetJ family transcriptional regulator